MRITFLASVALLPLSLAGCAVGDCAADDPVVPIDSGSYALAESEVVASRFPHAGRDVTIEVDRDARILRATWTDDEGAKVVETWRMVGGE